MTTLPLNKILEQLTDNDHDNDVVPNIDGKQVDNHTLTILCAHDKCRFKTLRLLLNHFLQHHPKEQLQIPLQDALFRFARVKHYQERPSSIARVVNLFRLYGADFFQKNPRGKDPFDYAHNTGNHHVLGFMLRLSPKNPIQKISVLLRRERRHPSCRDYMLTFLKNMKHEFKTEKGFVEGRAYSPFLPTFQANL